MILIVVYVGAVTARFVFVIMMLVHASRGRVRMSANVLIWVIATGPAAPTRPFIAHVQ
jgi:NADH:ubiquinone oxidoreductase subunit 6 (subunit J)